MNKGIIYASGAYLCWGFFPIFWKKMGDFPAVEILGHRMVWSLFFLVIVLVYRKQWGWLSLTLKNRVTLLTAVGTSCLLGVNWLTYIWAISAGNIVETSLGYFINPLVNVLLGVLFLRERIRVWQGGAIGVAAIGVGWLTVGYGALPWVALTLAFTFGFYGLLRKTGDLNALEGLSLEMSLLFLPALGYLIYLGVNGTSSFGNTGFVNVLLFVISGLITAVPLLLFAAGVRRIKLVTLGILQYMAPTIQSLLGIFLYGEPFPERRLIGFGFIWIALLIYLVEGIVTNRRQLVPEYIS